MTEALLANTIKGARVGLDRTVHAKAAYLAKATRILYMVL